MKFNREHAFKLLEENGIEVKKNESNRNLQALLEENEIVMETFDDEEDEEIVIDMGETPELKTRAKLDLKTVRRQAFNLGIPVDPDWSAEEIADRIHHVEGNSNAENIRNMVGTAQQKTRKLLELEPKVTIYVQPDQLNPQKKKEYVWINGVRFGMAVGHSYEVPKPVADVYIESRTKTNKALQRIKITELTID